MDRNHRWTRTSPQYVTACVSHYAQIGSRITASSSLPILVQLHRIFNETIFEWQTVACKVKATVVSACTYVFGSMVAMVAALALFVVSPILVNIDRSRDQ
jgi:hypothetical protein